MAVTKLSDHGGKTQIAGAIVLFFLGSGGAASFAMWAAQAFGDQRYAQASEVNSLVTETRDLSSAVTELSSVVLQVNVNVLDIQIKEAEANIAALASKPNLTPIEQEYLRNERRAHHDLQTTRETLYQLLLNR